MECSRVRGRVNGEAPPWRLISTRSRLAAAELFGTNTRTGMPAMVLAHPLRDKFMSLCNQLRSLRLIRPGAHVAPVASRCCASGDTVLGTGRTRVM